MAAPTWQDFFDTGVAEAKLRRPDLSVAVGDVSEMLIAGSAAMADRLAGYTAAQVRATYLDGARGDDLTTLCDDHWNIQRLLAVASQGTIRFTRTTANGISGTIATGSVVATSKDGAGNEIQFTTDADITYGASETGSKSVSVTARFAGLSGNVAASKVNRIITVLWDTFTVTNVALIAGGADEEADDDLRNRVRALPQTLRRGTLQALEYGAIQVATVKRATAFENLDSNGNRNGLVTVFVSDVAGNSNPTMVANVATEMENWRAAGVFVSIAGGSVLTQNIELTVLARVGTDTQALAASIQTAVTARVAKLKIGETLYRSMIKQAAMNVDPTNIQEITVALPATDVAAVDGSNIPNKIIRAGSVTVS